MLLAEEQAWVVPVADCGDESLGVAVTCTPPVGAFRAFPLASLRETVKERFVLVPALPSVIAASAIVT